MLCPLAMYSYYQVASLKAFSQQRQVPQLKQVLELEKNFCEACQSFKNERAHHCSTCNRCIDKMDHHCPWVVNCVGYKNHKCFWLFSLYSFVHSLPFFLGFLDRLLFVLVSICPIFRSYVQKWFMDGVKLGVHYVVDLFVHYFYTMYFDDRWNNSQPFLLCNARHNNA